MKILGYANRISAAADEPIEFKVSCDGLREFNAELVRVVQGDINPEGPGYQEKIIPLDLGGPFPGRFQAIHTGSYAYIDDHPSFDAITTFCVAA